MCLESFHLVVLAHRIVADFLLLLVVATTWMAWSSEASLSMVWWLCGCFDQVDGEAFCAHPMGNREVQL